MKNLPFKRFRYWLGDQICPDRIWNDDMSLEADRLTVDGEAKDELIKHQAHIIDNLRFELEVRDAMH